MKEFQASRLSEGNKVMPNTIKIDDFGVTLKIPGAFSGQEKTLNYHQISSVQIDSPMVGFSTITFDTIGWDRIIAKGFAKEDAHEVKRLCQLGIQGARGSGGTGNQGGSNLSEALAAQEAAKAQVESSKIQANLEEKKMMYQMLDEHSKEHKASVENITKIVFSNDQEEIGNQLNELISKLPSLKDDVKKVCVEKIEFGIQKLKKIGATHDATYFENKLEELKYKLSTFGFLSKKQWKVAFIIAGIALLLFIALAIFGKINQAKRAAESEEQMKELMKNLEQTEPETDASASSNNSSTSNESNVSNESTQPVNSNQSDFYIGNWKGKFGKDELLIHIESINDDGSVTGYNVVKNNKRELTGTTTGNEFELNEPGDQEWDGTFKLMFDDNKLRGIWISNNGKSEKQFELVKE